MTTQDRETEAQMWRNHILSAKLSIGIAIGHIVMTLLLLTATLLVLNQRPHLQDNADKDQSGGKNHPTNAAPKEAA